MQIIHRIDDFLYTLFPSIKDESQIVTILEDFYSYGTRKPKVKVENGYVIVELDIISITSVEADFDKAVSYCENGNYAEAKPLLEKLIRQDPTNSEFHRIIGQIYSDEGNQDEAINSLIDALRWDSNNGWALMMMGNIFSRYKKDISTALKYYNQAIIANKADHFTLANVAYLLLQENRLADSRKYAKSALKLKADYPNASFILSLIEQEEGNLQAAFDYVITTLKNCLKEDALYQDAVRQAFSIADKIASDTDNSKIYLAYRSQLEAEGGIEIDIIEDDTIPTAAKIEFAEIHNRETHIVKYKSTYPAVDHLLMHELVHLDFVIQARKSNLNQIFTSNQKNKQSFMESIQASTEKLKKKGLDATQINRFTDEIFKGLNLQIYNTPIDVFIEDFLYKRFKELQSYQMLSLYRLLQEGIASVTNKDILEYAPKKVVSKTKILSLVNALQFKELFGINLLSDFSADKSELKQADEFYKEFSKYKDTRTPGQEFDLVKSWGYQLRLDNFFELESEVKYESKSDIDEFLTKLQNDPFGLDEEEDPLEKKDMEQFQKNSEEIGTNMAVVMYMTSALKFFKDKPGQEIKDIAYEIAMQGAQGYNPNIKNYKLSSIPNKNFTGYQILAYYYVSWAIAMPDMLGELQLPFEEEYKVALTVFRNN